MQEGKQYDVRIIQKCRFNGVHRPAGELCENLDEDTTRQLVNAGYGALKGTHAEKDFCAKYPDLVEAAKKRAKAKQAPAQTAA